MVCKEQQRCFVVWRLVPLANAWEESCPSGRWHGCAVVGSGVEQVNLSVPVCVQCEQCKTLCSLTGGHSPPLLHVLFAEIAVGRVGPASWQKRATGNQLFASLVSTALQTCLWHEWCFEGEGLRSWTPGAAPQGAQGAP